MARPCGLWGSASSSRSNACRCCPAGREMARQGQTRAPVLRVARDEPLAQIDEAPRRAERAVGALEPLEREIRALGHGLHQRLPRLDGAGEVALPLARRRRGSGRPARCRRRCRSRPGTSSPRAATSPARPAGRADLVAQEAEDLLVLRAGAARRWPRSARARARPRPTDAGLRSSFCRLTSA